MENSSLNRMASLRQRDRAEPFENMGLETRTSILPTASAQELAYRAPSYDYAAAIPTPGSIGVGRGDSLDSVLNAVKGMAYYTDVIGFGESSSPLTQGMNFTRQGINYFMPTSQTCPNGAQMYMYVNGIPKGDGLGSRIQKALEEIDLPKLRGLAPGMLEDSKSALNPQPLIQAVLGDPYPDCEKVSLPVGDEMGRLVDPEDPANVWVQGRTEVINGRPQQTQWVQRKDPKGGLIFIDKKRWDCTQKTLNKNGTPIEKPEPVPASCNTKEGFSDYHQKNIPILLAIAAIGGIAVYYSVKKRA